MNRPKWVDSSSATGRRALRFASKKIAVAASSLWGSVRSKPSGWAVATFICAVGFAMWALVVRWPDYDETAMQLKMVVVWAVLFVLLLVSTGLGYLWGCFTGRRRDSVGSRYQSILQTIGKVAFEHPVATGSFAVVTLCALIALWHSSSGQARASILVAFAGVFFTIAAMHYAFQAERNSVLILEQRGFFLGNFLHFIRRVNRKLDQVYGDIRRDHDREKPCYVVKCMVLTPFLGYAGLCEDNAELYDQCEKFVGSIEDLCSTNGRCLIQMLTLEEEELLSWYSHIQWVERAKGQELNKGDNSTLIEEMLDAVVSDLVRKGVQGFQIKRSPRPVRSFKALVNHWANLSAHWQARDDRLRVGLLKALPFQCLLVSRIELKDASKLPETSAYVTDEMTGELAELEQYVILSFVGSETYRSFRVNRFRRPDIPHEKGIQGLLDDLHASIYSEDPNLCKILNNHFRELWRLVDKDAGHSYPAIADEHWSDKERIKSYLTSGSPWLP